jgi:hypothetical protein
MPIQDTAYVPRFRLPDVVQRSRACTLACPVYSGASLSAPTAAGSTCYVYSGTTTTAVLGGAITTPVVGSTATYPVAALDTASLALGSGYRVEWSLVMGDALVYSYRNPLHLVLRQLYPVLTDSDLTEGRYADLARYLGGSLTTFATWRETSWDEIQRRLLKDQRRPWLITEPSAFLDAHRELTYANFFRGLGQTQRSTGGQQDWLQLAEDHRRSYEREWSTLSFEYDPGEAGTTTRRETARPITVLCSCGDPRRA